MKVLYLNLNRCIDCRACEVACERVHDGPSRIRVTMADLTQPVPVSCRHCEDHPCAEVCPVEAIEVREDDAVIVREGSCMGCGLCVLACPFGVIELGEQTGRIAEKCDLCEHRREEGLQPACVLTCPTRCIQYGELEEIMEKARSSPGLTFVSAVGDTGTVITMPEPRSDSAESA
jgi:formate dehydrogenase iron-sulfur subunit